MVDSQPETAYDVVNRRAIWNIQKGEIAHLISEREFETAARLRGVVVPEGCTAIVFVGKEVVSVMQSGVYTFGDEKAWPTPSSPTPNGGAPAPNGAPSPNGGAPTPKPKSSGFWQGVKNFLFGKKKNEKPEQHQRRTGRILPKLQGAKGMAAPEQNLRVYLVSNRAINLLFDATMDDQENIEFAPMTIPTATVDVGISVSMQLQVQNMAEVAANYLSDSHTLRTLDLMQMLRATVKATLTQFLRNLDYQHDGLPDPVVSNLKMRLLQACNEQLVGIEATKVLSITDRSDDFERFRKLERDLYVSGRQLDYLQRTQAYKNRLEQQNNQQAVQQARNAEDLRKALQEINRDKLLSEDEMEQFTQMLSSQKRLREAKSDNEMRQALVELKKCGLVSDDEVNALKVELQQKQIDRNSVADVMRLQATHKLDMERQIMAFELSDSQQDHERAERLKAEQHKGTLLAAQLDTKRQLDSYADERKRQEQTLQHDLEFDATRHADRMTEAKLGTKRRFDAYQDEREQQAFDRRVRDENHEFDQRKREDAYQDERNRQALDARLSAELRTAQNQTQVAAAQLDTKRQLDTYQDGRDQRAFDQRVRNGNYEFEQQQRQRAADFKQRVQDEDYDFEKRQREDLHQFEQDQRAFQTRVKNEDYDFEKRQREDLHQFEQDQRAFQTRVKNEDYDFEKRQREQALSEQQAQADHQRKRQDKMDDMDILERKAALAQRNMQAIKQAELAELQERNRSAEAMEQMQQATAMNRDNQMATMDAEQIRAAQLSHLSAEAQVAMAQSYSSDKESQLRAQQQAEQQALYEKMLQQQAAQNAQNQDLMMKMAQMMQQGMTAVGQQQMQQQQQRIDDQRAMKEEYRDNAVLQQARMDHTQDVAMHHVSEVGTAVASRVGAFAEDAPMPPMPAYGEPSPAAEAPRPAKPERHCPVCGAVVDEMDQFCPECASRL